MTTLFPSVTVARCPKCQKDVRWIVQDAPRESLNAFYMFARRDGLTVHHLTDKDFEDVRADLVAEKDAEIERLRSRSMNMDIWIHATCARMGLTLPAFLREKEEKNGN